MKIDETIYDLINGFQFFWQVRGQFNFMLELYSLLTPED